MAVAILSSLVKKISSLVPQASSSSREPSSSSTEQELCHLEDAMKRIHAILKDVDEKDARDESEQLRLRELKEIAYDAEDVVDDYEYEVIEAKVEARRKLMACHLHADEVMFDWNSFHPNISISNELITTSRVKEIRKRFEKLTDDWDRISSRVDDGKRRRVEMWKSVETTRCFGNKKIYGREDEKDDIIEWLLGGNDRRGGRVSVLALVGMGGLGKTTLAQMLYMDPRVQEHFDIQGWVCMSEDFNVENILEKISKSFSVEVDSYMSLDKVFGNLKKKLKGKEFFLILDEVCDQKLELWNSLKTLLSDVGVGKILTITQNLSVANIMKTTIPIKLNILSFDNCWSMFSEIVFKSKDLDYDFIDIGKKIVKRCRGLPLVVNLLAGILRAEKDEETWTKILENELWELDDENDFILSVLKLSYDRMPIELRQCFMYLSLFPKYYPLKQSTIVRQWMAQGFLEANELKMEEDIGNDYFNELLHRSMVQESNDNRRFIMHDLVHDLAQEVAKAEYLLISTNKLHAYTIPKTIRHMSVFVDEYFKIEELELLFGKNLHLRTLMLDSMRIFQMNHLVHNLINLRTLSFHAYPTRKKSSSHKKRAMVIDFFGTHKHLRYLSLSLNANAFYIPRSVYKLYHLQTLDLGSDQVVKLAEGISDLVNLHHFFGLSLPNEVRWLANLQSLRCFVVGAETGECKVRHLKNLVNLRGKLGVSGLGTVDPSDITPWEAYLKERSGIVKLSLCFDGNSAKACDYDEKVEEKVLDSLRPHPDIESLCIAEYPGAMLPTWLGSFSKLEALTLEDCMLTSLPTLGQLPSLKVLRIARMKRMKSVGPEFLYALSPPPAAATTEETKRSCFPSLEVLDFAWNLPWEKWHGVDYSDFPCLRILWFTFCPKLCRFPHLPALQKLGIYNCPKLWLPYLPSVTELHLHIQWNSGFLYSDFLPMLRVLVIKSLFDDCISFTDNQSLHSIEKLFVIDCWDLVSVAGLGNLISLQHLEISNCPKLHSVEKLVTAETEAWSLMGLSNLTSLQHLKIYKCPLLHISPNQRLRPNLQYVKIHGSPFAKWYQYLLHDYSSSHQMDSESEQDEDDNANDAISMNLESEQDEEDFGIEANIDDLNI